jgi:putative transposase
LEVATDSSHFSRNAYGVARKKRGDVYEGTYHVWRRAAGPIEMFRDDTDRSAFCNRLARVIAKYQWVCHAFILMPTHFHLVLTVLDNVLQPGMRDAFGPYAQEFNRRWARSGHLKAAPYGLRRIEDEADFCGVVRYVARNPVRKQLCAAPQDWQWSSYPGSAGYAEPFWFVDDRAVLAMFDDDRARASWLLRVFVETS